MKPALRIPLVLTLIVFLTGVIAIIKTSLRGGAILTTPFYIWVIASVILIAITVWSWVRSNRSSKQP